MYDRLSKIAHFIVTIEKILVEGLTRLFRNNMWKLYELPKYVISDRKPQFIVELIKELNKMSEIEMKLLIAFHSQIDE